MTITPFFLPEGEAQMFKQTQNTQVSRYHRDKKQKQIWKYFNFHKTELVFYIPLFIETQILCGATVKPKSLIHGYSPTSSLSRGLLCPSLKVYKDLIFSLCFPFPSRCWKVESILLKHHTPFRI